MSLINDALKRVEQSLNDNSPDQKFKNQMPSYSMESSGRNKKLFFIAVIGGTLFFSILILLLVLIFSQSPSPSSPLPPYSTPNSTNAIINQPEESKKEKASSIDTLSKLPIQPIDAVEIDQNDIISERETEEPSENVSSEDAPKDSPPSTDSASKVTVPRDSNGKDLNEEFFESIVDLASKAFTVDPKKTKAKNSNSESKNGNNALTEENFTLSTAQSTLDKIQRESELPKEAPKSKVQQFIDTLAVTGVMISKDDSMALINNRVFSKNSIVDSNFNLTLIEIQPQKIVLRDGAGVIYNVDF